MAVSAWFYDGFMYPLEAFKLHRIRSRLLKNATGAVLEVGGGTCVNGRYLFSKNISTYINLDLDPMSVKDMRKKFILSKSSVVAGDVAFAPFPDNSFDTVISTLLFCSVFQPRQGILELQRVFKARRETAFYRACPA